MTHTNILTGGLLRYIPQLALFATLILSSISSSAQSASAKQRGEKKTGLTLEQFKKISMFKGSRKIEIVPIKPAEGIATGGVVAYGHFIPPPYKVEYPDERLLINGVQVMPSLVRERERREHPMKPLSPENQAIQEKVGRLIRDAEEIYAKGKWLTSASVRQQKVLEMLGKHPDLVQKPRWQSEVLCYSTPVYSGSSCVNFGPSMFSSPKMQARNEAKNVAERISEIERLLAEGMWVCFGSTLGGMGTTHDSRASVNEIMKNPALSRNQKVELLEEHVFKNYDLALDVVDNYSAKEWGIAK